VCVNAAVVMVYHSGVESPVVGGWGQGKMGCLVRLVAKAGGRDCVPGCCRTCGVESKAPVDCRKLRKSMISYHKQLFFCLVLRALGFLISGSMGWPYVSLTG